MSNAGMTLLADAKGALYQFPDAVARRHRLDRDEVSDLLRELSKDLGHTAEFAELKRLIEGSEAEAQTNSGRVALLIAALFSVSANAIATPHAPSTPQYATLGQEFPLADRSLRVRNVEAMTRYRDTNGVVHTAAPGHAFVRVFYQERNDGRSTLDTCALRRLNFGGDQAAEAASVFFEDTNVFVEPGESFTVRVVFEVPESALGHNGMLYFVRPTDPVGGFDASTSEQLRARGDAARVLVALPALTG